ncbi:calponin-like protein, partial [Leptotrombidium deliense]
SNEKFDIELALQAINWLQNVTALKIEPTNPAKGFQDQFDFAEALKDGIALCQLMNVLSPGLITKINTKKTPFKERENVEMFLNVCEAYGLKNSDLFQVNDLYEKKNVHKVVNCLHAIAALAVKKGFIGPTMDDVQAPVSHKKRIHFAEQKLESKSSETRIQR